MDYSLPFQSLALNGKQELSLKYPVQCTGLQAGELDFKQKSTLDKNFHHSGQDAASQTTGHRAQAMTLQNKMHQGQRLDSSQVHHE